jgi:uncharacterized protein YutE (UPF0331/DUF86 family)
MTPVVERLAELRRHLEHLRAVRPRVRSEEDLEGDLSLHNDVLFSLLTVAQLVIDVAAELVAREGHPFEDYTTAVRALRRVDPDDFPPEMVEELARLPGFRNILIHEYVGLDYELVIRALDHLDPVERFVRIVAERVSPPEEGDG